MKFLAYVFCCVGAAYMATSCFPSTREVVFTPGGFPITGVMIAGALGILIVAKAKK